MPIYEYICHSCNLEKEHLQKMSDPPIENCPECGSSHYVKQISAAGFQLKGSGWYVTDFKNKPTSGAKSKPDTKGESTVSSTAAPDTKGESAASTIATTE